MFTQRPDPVGVNQPLPIHRQPITNVVSGDEIALRAMVDLTPGVPATPANSILVFVLSFQRFTPASAKVWEGRWHAGIEEVDAKEHPGLIEVKLPKEISMQLQRGSFIYSLLASDLLGEKRKTVIEGTLLVEYAPTGPIHTIPYKD